MPPEPRLMTPQGSHWPTLEACIAHTAGPVLELGCGRESTRQLHDLCAGRRLVSLDNNEQFVQEFADLQSEMHSIRFADYATSPLLDEPWDVALVDEAPASSRTTSIRRLAQRARIIVAHDTETEQLYHWNEIWAEFRHYKHISPEGLPRTTVMSNTDDLSFLE